MSGAVSPQNVLETDKRDDPFIPTSGYHSKLTQEVAGLGGDVIFSKAEMQTTVYKELLPNWVCYIFEVPLLQCCIRSSLYQFGVDY